MSVNAILSLIKQKEYGEALDMIREEQAFFPTHALLQRSEIFCLFKLHRIEEARVLCERNFESQKNEAFFLSTYLQILEKLGENDSIRDIVERIRSKGPSEIRLFTLIIRLLRGHPERGDFEAFKIYAKEIFPKEAAFTSQDPQNDYRHYKEYYKKTPAREAITEIKSLLVLPRYRSDKALKMTLAELEKSIGAYDEARQIYEEMLREEHSIFVVKLLGFLLKKAGKDKEALPYLREAFIEKPSDVILRKNFMQLCERAGEKLIFIESVKQALQTHPEDRYLYGLLKKADKWKKQET